MKICKIKGITRFALNVILVLEGVRLSYHADIPTVSVNKFFVDLAVHLSGVLSIIPTTEFKYLQPLLVLETRVSEINKLHDSLTEEENFQGKVLGYSYYGNDWRSRECHAVDLSVEHIETKERHNLYSFTVPVAKYTEKIRKDILKIVEKFDRMLSKYGYRVFAMKCECGSWNEERIQ